jgi:proteic killer suppression protein
VTRYSFAVIRSFKHAGLERFFQTGIKAGIQPSHANRLRLQLFALNRAVTPSDMNAPGWRLHALKGDLAGHFAITVNGNCRMTFRLDGEDAVVVDYQDYH